MINLIYIHFTDEQKQKAASVDLEAFLRSRGERLISSGRDKRLASDHSVTICGNEWYDHAEEKGGTAISFVQRYYGIGYADAAVCQRSLANMRAIWYNGKKEDRRGEEWNSGNWITGETW